MDELFEIIREEASKEVWSRGVELARQDSVTGELLSSGEVEVRVFDRSRGVSAIIHLWPEDQEWNRDCACKIDPCAHVVAALITLRRAQEQGQSLPQGTSPSGHLEYAFTRSEGALAFERLVVSEGQTQVLNVPLSSLIQGRFQDIIIAPSKHDLAIESALGGERRGKLRTAVMQKLLPLLSEVQVSLDSLPCAIQKEPLGLHVFIRDEGLGIHVIGKRDKRILESFSNSAVLSSDGLHPQADLQLDPADRDTLQRGQIIPLRDLERFASEKLPLWQQRFKLENSSLNLPSFVHAEPELEISLEKRGEGMVMQTGIVYGQPAIARIVEGVFRPLGQKVPIRDYDAERRLKDELWRQWGLELHHSRYLPSGDALRLVESLNQWKGRRRGDGYEIFRKVPGKMQPEIRWEQGRFDISWTLDSGTDDPGVRRESRTVSGAAVLRAWEQDQKLVPLLEGGFADLPRDWMQRYGKLVADLLHAQEDRQELPRAVQAQAAQLFDELGLDTPPDLAIFQKLQSRDWSQTAPTLPSAFSATLRPYQEQGVAWLQHMRELALGALLADDMGLGKTVQTLAVLERSSLILAPTSVLPNWKKELQRFRPDLRFSLYHGSNRTWDPEADVVLSSYGILRQEPERFQNQAWSALVLDEAQIIKNPESKIAQAAQSLQAPFKLALSGTPVENRLDDLWSIFAFLNPGLLGGRKDFRDRWSRPIEEGQDEVAQRLRQLLKPFVLRRLKRDVATDLPPRIEKVLYAELWPEERKLYEAIYAATRQDVVGKLKAGGSVMEALEALLRMRQACCHPALIPNQTAAHSSKLNLLIELLETALAEGHKALVFSQWTSLLDLLEPMLTGAGITFLRLDGSTKDRQSVVDRFQEEQGPPVLIMSLKAGGVGLNLTRADHVFILDPWWNPAAADQAADRAHRIGQDRTVMIHPLVALDSIEEKIMELQNQKRALATAALGEGAAIPSITRDDLLYLLGEAR